MDKIKKVLSPGSKKDDEVLYGNAEERRRESAGQTTGQTQPEQLRPVEGSQKKEHSILGQLTNPGGDKYDDQRYGTTATTAPPDLNKLETYPETARKEHTIMDQLTNPAGDKYDPKRFEATASTPGDRQQSVLPEAPATVGPNTTLVTDPEEKKHEHSILRQIINPHGAKYDQEGYGTTAHAASGAGTNFGQDAALVGGGAAGATTASQSQPLANRTVVSHTHPTTTTTTTTTTSQSQQPLADRSVAGDTHINPIGAPETTAPSAGQSHLGRDAAVAGGAGLAGGAAASELNRPRDDIAAATFTERSQPLAGSATNTSAIAGAGPTGTAGAGATHVNPIGAPEQNIQGQSHLGRDAAVAGGIGAGGVAASSGATQLNRAPADVQAATYTDRAYPVGDGVVHRTSGPHITETANRLDPHIPGEFPTESGLDRHAAQPAIVPTDSTVPQSSTAGSGIPVGGSAANMQQSREAGLGRDAAAAGGLGAAGGAVTYAATRGNETTGLPVGASTTTSQPTNPTVTGERVGESHTGRDAALAGGAGGAAGIAAYEASRNTAPVSQTIGSQPATSSTVASQPIGSQVAASQAPTSSTATDRADPLKTQQEPHYGRDAAVAGGALGAGAVAAERHNAPTAADTNDPATKAARDATQKHSHGSDKVYGGDGAVRDDKHDQKLQKAREEEHAHGGDRGEKKRGLLDKILHPGHHDKESNHHDNGAKTTTDDHGHTVLHKKALGDPHHESERVIEPHTGLPMDLSKGVGQGGTDGATQIHGYHETDPALRQATAGTAEGAGTKHPAHHAGEEGVAGPDWDAIKKSNTPY